MCWGCMHPSFPDSPSSPFFRPAATTPEFLGLSADNFAEILLVGGVAAIGVHAARHMLTNKEEPREEKKSLLMHLRSRRRKYLQIKG